MEMQALRAYLREVVQVQTLPPDEERTLCRRIDGEYRTLTEALLAIPFAAQRLQMLCAIARGSDTGTAGDVPVRADDVLASLRRLAHARSAAAASRRVDDVIADGRVDASKRQELLASIGRASSGLALRPAFVEQLAAGVIAGGIGSHVRRVARSLERLRDLEAALMRANLPLVLSLAARYRQTDVPLLDLVQEGNRALSQVVDHFDYGGESDFSACATWAIRRAIRAALTRRLGDAADSFSPLCGIQ